MDIEKVELYHRLGYIISSKIRFEWMKVSMFDPKEKYARFPVLYFRFYSEDMKTNIEKISKVLNSYCGQNKWCIFKYPFSKKNIYSISVNQYYEYVIRTSIEDYVSPQTYFGEDYYRELYDSVIEDIELLCDYVDKNL